MTAEGHKVASLHGAKDAAERDAIIDHFREGRDKVSHFIASFQIAGTKKIAGSHYHQRHCQGYRYSPSEYGGKL